MIELGVVDLEGKIRTRSSFLPLEKIKEFGFDGSSIGLASIEDSDLLAKADLSKVYRFKTMNEEVEFYFCNIFKNENQYELDLRRFYTNFFANFPFKVNVGFELEFYIIGKNEENGKYMFPFPVDKEKFLIRNLMKALNELGFKPIMEHSEVGEGQHEIVVEKEEASSVADKITFFKYFLNVFFFERGKQITFMPKPFYGLAGNGMHIHLSLEKNGRKISFLSSEEGKSFLEGILAHIKEITLFLNPSVNSYKRLVPGFEAPCYISWGIGNRSTLVRIPNYRKGDEFRIEVRSPDPLANPYLAIVLLVSAGLDGIENKLKIRNALNENAYHKNELETLPGSLKESIEEAKKSEFVKKVLGNIAEIFIKRKEKEWKEYEEFCRKKNILPETKEITEWEKKKYLYC